MTPQEFFKNDLFAENAGVVLLEVREGYSKAKLEIKKVCRNTRCAFFFFIDYKNRFIFFKLRCFEDFFGLCVRNI